MIENAYIATGACGKLVGVTAIMPEHKKETAKDVAGWLRAGFEITRVSVEHVGKADWCGNRGKCKKCKENDHEVQKP